MFIWLFVLLVLILATFVFLLSNTKAAGYYAAFLGILVLVPAFVLIFKHIDGWRILESFNAKWYEPKTELPDLSLYIWIILGYILLLVGTLVVRGFHEKNFGAGAFAGFLYLLALVVIFIAGFTEWSHYAVATEAKHIRERSGTADRILDDTAVDKYGIAIPSNYNPPALYHFKYSDNYNPQMRRTRVCPDYRGTIYNIDRNRQSSGTKKWQSEMDRLGKDVVTGLMKTGYTVYFCKGDRQLYYGTEGTGPMQVYPQPIIVGVRDDVVVVYTVYIESPVLDPPPWVELSVFTEYPDLILKEIERAYESEQVTDAATFKTLRFENE